MAEKRVIELELVDKLLNDVPDGYEPQTSGVESDHSTNRATNTASIF